MAYASKEGWLADLPSPYDIKCRNLFKIFEITVRNPRHEPSYQQVEEKYRTFTQIRELLREQGISEWMVNNDVPPQHLQFAARYNPETNEYYLTVLIDMPEELKTLYRLTFN